MKPPPAGREDTRPRPAYSGIGLPRRPGLGFDFFGAAFPARPLSALADFRGQGKTPHRAA